jgi:hypothetical protein
VTVVMPCGGRSAEPQRCRQQQISKHSASMIAPSEVARGGATDGTLLLDLERRQVVDLLPERSDVALARLLRAHPGRQHVSSRDRGGDYTAGATFGAPQVP